MNDYDRILEAADFLRNRLGSLAPRLGIVLGSGLGAVADAVADPAVVPCAEIPHFPLPTVADHLGRFLAGRLNGAPVAILQGRVHFYEGFTPAEIVLPVRVLGALGIRAVNLTTAAGGIHESYRQRW